MYQKIESLLIDNKKFDVLNKGPSSEVNVSIR